MKREVVKSVVWALIVTVLLGVAIVVGSRNLSRFDSALVAYTFASLFAAFGLTYRYAMWLQRPPTALYWRRGWEAFFKRPYRKQNAINWFKRVIADFALNHFIWLRGNTGG
jgi:high-affinity Fe2+/Pb2+ permease